ncbi:2-keto-4-pentenoate hydratase [Carbonactinospora thermoautotrophica]|uniref:2-keto-4-pentenoate hydratase n=1 Tax=Carbonactinospora thermoautotrophica TaxID=1469144 RepID=A0A132MNI7_9ACTN|nr:2-keto-4-pentenoate hydratase [Carbonactinospora thermoautotrophica]KWW97608.1 2-keto-4-pentenoate hydratase [Carbonactinospora thermoautotrophica]KWW98971.1 4-oxalocrotonate decarboxylase [Carbonactinospora thermoautotrophica]KWX09739.1 2-keto-4-pentenoate hydratase [Carbonactinospora thermoautotrophica]MCX9191543.1 2-keto-4-pentenoate hydratase [Carbonactinospora thermoautotrophica]
MDAQTRRLAADLLLSAYETGAPVEPLTEKFADLTVEDAYGIQLAQVEQWCARGARVKGHKVGLTSAAMQRQMGVDTPDFGHLLDSMFFLENLPIPVGRFLQPRVEPEVAFVLKSPLAGPGVTAAEAAAAVDFVLPALEIIDSRIRDWRITLVDTIADNASSGGVVLGSRPTPLSAVDLRLAGCTVHRGGEVVATGAGGAVLGSPLNALVWLANTLGPLGVSLEAGQVVLPGSVTAAVPVAAGDVVTATFAGLGSVTAVFEGA